MASNVNLNVNINEYYKKAAELQQQKMLQAGEVKTPKTGSGAISTPTESSVLDTKRISEIARKNAEKSGSVNEATVAQAGTAADPVTYQPNIQSQLPKVDAKTAIDFKSGSQNVLSSALKFNANVASDAYMKTAEKSNGLDVYNQLSKVRLNPETTSAKSAGLKSETSNPFAGQYTGLSFMYSPDDIIA